MLINCDKCKNLTKMCLEAIMVAVAWVRVGYCKLELKCKT